MSGPIVTSRPGRLLTAALVAAGIGPVFPCRPGTADPAIRDWQTRATRDPGRIYRAWRTGEFNIGVSCMNLVVLRLRPPAPGLVASGLDLLDAVAAGHGRRVPLDTYTTGHPDSSVQLWFTTTLAAPPVRSGDDLIARLVDVRGPGRFVLGAGSILPGSTGAEALVEVFDDAPAAPLPAWLAGLIAGRGAL